MVVVVVDVAFFLLFIIFWPHTGIYGCKMYNIITLFNSNNYKRTRAQQKESARDRKDGRWSVRPGRQAISQAKKNGEEKRLR